MPTELEKLRVKETELSDQLVKIVNKRTEIERELLPVIGAAIAAHARLQSCRKAIASLALP